MDYIKTLEKEYLKRKQKNERYSIRAFSNFLGVQSATLSAVLKKNRHLSIKDAEEIALKLFTSEEESKQFITSYLTEKTKINDECFLPDDEDFFPFLTDWEYAAILTLMDNKDFSEEPRWIAARLNLDPDRVIKILNHLEKLKLISHNEEGKLIKLHRSFQTSEDINSKALRLAHQKELTLAMEKHEETDIEDREFGSMIIALEKRKIPQLKKKIREFVDQIERSYESENSDEVYLLAYQLFPLTNTDHKPENYQ